MLRGKAEGNIVGAARLQNPTRAHSQPGCRLLLHDAVWVLPATPWTREQFQWLAVEIGELGGEAYLWESHLLLNGQADALVQQFQARVDAAYQEILDEVEQEDADLVALSRKYQQVRAQDYFHSALGTHVRERLMSARGGFVS